MAAFILNKDELKEYKKILRTKRNIFEMLQEISLREEYFLDELNEKYKTQKHKGLSINSKTGEVEMIK